MEMFFLAMVFQNGSYDIILLSSNNEDITDVLLTMHDITSIIVTVFCTINEAENVLIERYIKNYERGDYGTN